MTLINRSIHRAQKIDRLQILAAAEFVGNPLTFLARIIEVEHGGHRIDAQAIGVIFRQPVQGIAEQKAAHFLATQIENRTVPVGMKPLTRIGMLKEMRAVEVSQTVFVGGEM